MKVIVPAITVCILFLLACQDQPGYVSKQENDGDAVYTVEKEDPAMNAAIEEARRTYPDFLKTFNARDTANGDFTVKSKFSFLDEDGERNFEHMWMVDLYYKGDQLHGVLGSDPISINWTVAGDSLAIKTDSISDWMYVRDGKLVGGYTVRVLYDKMSEQEKKEFSSQLPYKID